MPKRITRIALWQHECGYKTFADPPVMKCVRCLGTANWKRVEVVPLSLLSSALEAIEEARDMARKLNSASDWDRAVPTFAQWIEKWHDETVSKLEKDTTDG